MYAVPLKRSPRGGPRLGGLALKQATSKFQIASILQAARYYREARGTCELLRACGAGAALDSLASAASAALRLTYSTRATAAA